MTTLNRRDLFSAGALAAAGLTANVHAAPADKADAKNPKFQLGIVTYNIAAAWDVPTILKVCKAVGLSPVELRTTHKHGVEPTLSKEQRQEVRKRFADAGVAIWGCGSVCEFQSPDPAVVKKNIETCKEFVQLAADIGGKGVKVRPNGLPKDVPVEKTLEQIGKALIPCGKAAADAGVEIWVEVHGNGTSHPPHCKTIMEHCGHAKRRPDLELATRPTSRTAPSRSISSCCGRGSSRATSTSCTRTRPATIRIANCSACSARPATTA